MATFGNQQKTRIRQRRYDSRPVFGVVSPRRRRISVRESESRPEISPKFEKSTSTEFEEIELLVNVENSEIKRLEIQIYVWNLNLDQDIAWELRAGKATYG